VAVAQLAEHIAAHLEELAGLHVVVYAYLIFMIDGIPIQSVLLLFVVEEAVVLVDNLPKGFEVAGRGVIVLFRIDTRSKKYDGRCKK
jgi:hypothetical protein